MARDRITAGRLPDLFRDVTHQVIWAPTARCLVLEEAAASADGCETGGILLGHGPDTAGRLLITDAGGPGPLAARRQDYFLRDLSHAQDLAAHAWARGRARWIGEWHTHPHGSVHPSQRDRETYAALLADPQLEFEVVVAAIVVPGADDGWRDPSIVTWVVSAL